MSVTAARRLSTVMGLFAVALAAPGLFAATAGGRSVARQVDEPTGQGTATVLVAVADESGSPVPSARVIIWPAEYADEEFARNGQTDASGQAAVANVRPGRHTAYVDVPGYPIAASDEFDLDSGDLLDLGTLRLAAGVLVTGRAVDGDGDPVAGVRVEASRMGHGWPDPWEPSAMTTGADGVFRLAGVPSTGGFLGVEDDRYSLYSQWLQFPDGHTGEFALRPTNMGGRKGAILLEFVDEAGRLLDSPLPPDWEGPARGYRGDGWVPTVTDSERRYSSEYHDYYVRSLVTDGIAEWEKQPGVWRLFVYLPGHRPIASPLRRVDRTGASPATWWEEVTVEPGQTTRVRYALAPLPRAGVEIVVRGRRPDGGLTALAGAYVDIGDESVATDGGGRAVLAAVPVGVHRVIVGGATGFHARELELAIVAPRTNHVVILDPAHQAQLRMISGAVLAPASRTPLTAATLEILTIAGTPAWGEVTATTDEAGRFEATGDLPEGPYLVTVEQHGQELGSQIIWVTAEPEQDFVIRPAVLAETRPARIDVHGTVSGMGATRSYSIYAQRNNELYEDLDVPVSASGSFLLPALGVGHWRLLLRVQHGPTCGVEIEQTVWLRGGEPARVHFALPPLHEFSGRLTGDLRDVQSVRIVSLEHYGCMAQATIASDGSFGPVWVPEGTHELWALRGKPWRWPVYAEVRTFPDVNPVELHMAPASLHVRVVDGESGEPLPHADVGLRPMVGRTFNGFAGPAIRVDQTGEFYAEPLAHGMWTLAVEHERIEVDLAPGEAKQMTVAVSAGIPVRARYQGGSRPATRLSFTDSGGHPHHAYFDTEREIEEVLAPGVYDLVAVNEYGYEHAVRVTWPGPEIVLPDPPQRGQLRVLVPELYLFEGDLRTTLTLEGGDEVIVGERGDGSREALQRLDAPARGAVVFEHVPAGEYEIHVLSEDGREFRGDGTVIPFTENDIIARSTGIRR